MARLFSGGARWCRTAEMANVSEEQKLNCIGRVWETRLLKVYQRCMEVDSLFHFAIFSW